MRLAADLLRQFAEQFAGRWGVPSGEAIDCAKDDDSADSLFVSKALDTIRARVRESVMEAGDRPMTDEEEQLLVLRITDMIGLMCVVRPSVQRRLPPDQAATLVRGLIALDIAASKLPKPASA